jgi:hypothetical protein
MAAGAARWIDDLPGIVAALERDWAITAGRTLSGGTDSYPADLMAGDPRDRSRWLAERTGRDETAIWEWGVVERMSTGLLCTQIGLQPQGRLLLAAAETLAG